MDKLLLMAAGLAALGFLFMTPLAFALLYASRAGLAAFWAGISSPEALHTLMLAIALGVATTLINGVLGTTVAFMMARRDFPLKRLIDSALELPVAIPASVTGFTLLLLYGPLDLVAGRFPESGAAIVLASAGLLAAHVLMTLPIVAKAVGPALRDLDRNHAEAARTLGAGEARVFTSVVAPAIMPALMAGSLLTFARSFGELGATAMVSGALEPWGEPSSLRLLFEYGGGDIGATSAMPIVLVVASFGLVVGLKLMARRTHTGRSMIAKRDIA
jgi:sulfate transport system permease protein